MPGQRTPIFQRYPRPEKECQSFSLIYSDRSLDVICKDKDEAEVWFAGLKTLISRSRNRKWRSESRSDIVSSSGTTSPRTFTRRSSPLSSPFSSNDSVQKVGFAGGKFENGSDNFRLRSSYGSPPKAGLDKTFSDVVLYTVPPKGFFPSDSTVGSYSMSSGTSDATNGHVAVLTSRTEVYTWGKGANGRLGHGDTDDRNMPTLVEALKDKQVWSVVCGTNFTAAICTHRWVSGVDQSMCSGCRLPFNFKRKRHNCYNCALVYCHSCSSKTSLKAALAPNNNKPYRVCDACCTKLNKPADTGDPSFSVRKGRTVIFDTIEDERTTGSRSNIQLSRLSSIKSFKQTEMQSNLVGYLLPTQL